MSIKLNAIKFSLRLKYPKFQLEIFILLYGNISKFSVMVSYISFLPMSQWEHDVYWVPLMIKPRF